MWIFLDIDGVLVPEKKFDRPVSKEDYMKFDPECIEKFENVLRRFTEAKVVISSSWREIFPFEVIPPLFSTDITSRIVGATPFLETRIIHDFQFLRHQEVLEYLRQNQSKGSSWVAVDDIPEHYAPNAPVVATDPYMGFDDNSAKKLTQYLTAFRI
ncbi:MAG: HAD domain-containing protein [Pseudanabaena sp.]